MGPVLHEKERIWTTSVLLSYFWTVEMAMFAVAATFIFEATRRGHIIIRFSEPGEPLTMTDFLLRETGTHLPNVLLTTLPFIAAMAALSVALYVVVNRGKGDCGSLLRRVGFGWLLVAVPCFVVPNGMYMLSTMWAIAVVPASSVLYPRFWWRVVEAVAFGLISMSAMFLPIID